MEKGATKELAGLRTGERSGGRQSAPALPFCPPARTQKCFLACPYLARVLVSVQPGTNHVVGDYARVEDLTLLPAKESYPGAGQALVVLH